MGLINLPGILKLGKRPGVGVGDVDEKRETWWVDRSAWKLFTYHESALIASKVIMPCLFISIKLNLDRFMSSFCNIFNN